MKYDNDALAELCSKIDLLDYISANYEVKKMGDKYFMHCPVHKNDNTPSLNIITESNKFYCFGCGVKGSIIDWKIKIEHKKFNEAVDDLSKLAGYEIKHLKTCEALAFYKSLKRLNENSTPKGVVRQILPKSTLDSFSSEPPQEWVQEDMSEEVLREYEIMIDKNANRIVYPIYDNNDNLIGIKGRTRFENYKELGISKYMNYHKIQTTDFFVGMKNNREEIINKKSVVIFEGIKSGLKYTTYGLGKNWLAAETSCLNNDQVKILISLGIKEVNIAFDSDVCLDKIKKCTELLRQFTNVYYVRNVNNLIGDKMSPIDCGKEVFEELFRKRVKL